jgi:hypothetical protein
VPFADVGPIKIPAGVDDYGMRLVHLDGSDPAGETAAVD